MITVKASTAKAYYKTLIVGESNSIVSDEPLENGGNNEGFSPKELLASSLASCTSITLRMYCERKQIITDNIEVIISIGKDENGITIFNREININIELSEEQKIRIVQIANACPVSKILSAQNVIKTSLIK